ncbi:hypothetical protein HNP46_000457 [Pseudomonas nitritireducens]|uniref:Uncharacterized protein n=1 Tax=Pseudomonas nitroreducens TaxID=46680 RepID=A0A7W7KFS3_PSENT|nr:hypothetical protein [Pseudomonas nitritireducens]
MNIKFPNNNHSSNTPDISLVMTSFGARCM